MKIVRLDETLVVGPPEPGQLRSLRRSRRNARTTKKIGADGRLDRYIENARPRPRTTRLGRLADNTTTRLLASEGPAFLPRLPIPEYIGSHTLLPRGPPRAAGQSAVSCSLSRAAAPSAIYTSSAIQLYTSPRLQRPRRGRASQHVVVVVVVHGGDVGRRPGAPRATAALRPCLRRHPHPPLHGRGLGRLVVAAVVVVRVVVVPAARRLVVGWRPGWAEGQGRDCNWSSGRGSGSGCRAGVRARVRVGVRARARQQSTNS